MRRAVLPKWLLLATLVATLIAALLPGLTADRFADGPGATSRSAPAVGPVAGGAVGTVAPTIGTTGGAAEEEPEGAERGRGSTAPAAPLRRDVRTAGTATRSAARSAVCADGPTAPRTPPDTAGRPAPAARPAGPAELRVFRC
ncbi:hypothetical protein [Kitasatospora sp. CB02891]|uniref:hypothetical protein n=1 Tax=Kitasatospora sp. CB02891 TaxID=2020329 RepID=UPI000C27F91C|nr:hypothetical protein [Kitasatospora sp. CB02891]PJN25402.1 hypothetical protein CG736_13360 [Kitasatospora sp. CB02891]